ncbi:MAG TPA: YceI family protein [Methylomirabilota bacterium]|jgi:polyisoprenoid-binding protein YceI|nr:YceI family protein [Methylomirabilota bacterium]
MDSATGGKMSPETSAVHYTIDPASSRFTVRAFAAGLLSGFGHNPVIAIREFSGEVNFAPDNLAGSSVGMTIQAGSFEVQNDVSETDLREITRTMNDQALEVKRFPEIAFESRQVSGMQLGESLYVLKIEGDLFLHGVTRPQTLSANVAAGDDKLRAYGEFLIKQSDFKIRLVSVAGGALKVKDELKLAFDIITKRDS